MDFFAHATMHRYMLTKEKMPDSLREKVKAFMEIGQSARDNGTLNMKLMHQTSGLLCAEESPDFTRCRRQNLCPATKNFCVTEIVHTLKTIHH